MSVGCSGSSLYGFGGRAGFGNSCFGLREAETGDGTEKKGSRCQKEGRTAKVRQCFRKSKLHPVGSRSGGGGD